MTFWVRRRIGRYLHLEKILWIAKKTWVMVVKEPSEALEITTIASFIHSFI